MFRGITPVVESQMEKNMEHEMETGMVRGLQCVGIDTYIMVLDSLYSYGVGRLI